MADKVDQERWADAADVRRMLANMLEMPTGDHSAAVADNLHSPLTNAHVVGLFQLVHGKTIKWDAALWCGSTIQNRAVALHVWLYHLVGAGADLEAPSKLKDTISVAFSKALSDSLKPYCERKTGRFDKDMVSIKGALSRDENDEDALRRLSELRSSLFDIQRLRMKTPGGGGGGGGGSAQTWEEQTAAPCYRWC